MKKTLSILVAAVLMFTLASCSFLKAENTPEDVVKGYLDALKVVDMEKMDASYYAVESSDEQVTDEDIEIFKALYQDLTYEIISTEEDGTEATVKVKCNKVDYLKAADAMTALAVENIENGTADGSEGDDYYMDLLLQCLAAEDAARVEEEVEIDCIRIGNKWYLNAENDDLEDFLYGDLELE